MHWEAPFIRGDGDEQRGDAQLAHHVHEGRVPSRPILRRETVLRHRQMERTSDAFVFLSPDSRPQPEVVLELEEIVIGTVLSHWSQDFGDVGCFGGVARAFREI